MTPARKLKAVSKCGKDKALFTSVHNIFVYTAQKKSLNWKSWKKENPTTGVLKQCYFTKTSVDSKL